MASTANRKGDGFNANRRELVELSALADGTLDPGRQAEVQARIAASPELSVLYDRERHVSKMLHDSWSTIRAPAALRIWVETERATPRKALHRAAYRAAPAAALASLLLVALLISPVGTPGAPPLSQAAALASRGPSAPAPALDPSAPSVALSRNLEGVYFPNWAPRFGWRAVGQRVDHINGRLARTVYYDRHAHRIAYIILAAPALAQPRAVSSQRDGTELRTLTVDGRTVVTWRRAGHTCVLSSVGMPAAELEQLAAWRARGLDHE